eukprot:7384971-Prymnesium_polylepis.1
MQSRQSSRERAGSPRACSCGPTRPFSAFASTGSPLLPPLLAPSGRPTSTYPLVRGDSDHPCGHTSAWNTRNSPGSGKTQMPCPKPFAPAHVIPEVPQSESAVHARAQCLPLPMGSFKMQAASAFVPAGLSCGQMLLSGEQGAEQNEPLRVPGIASHLNSSGRHEAVSAFRKHVFAASVHAWHFALVVQRAQQASADPIPVNCWRVVLARLMLLIVEQVGVVGAAAEKESETRSARTVIMFATIERDNDPPHALPWFRQASP